MSEELTQFELNLLKSMIRSIPVVYRQINALSSSSSEGSTFTLECDFDSLDPNSLLLFVPNFSSMSGNNTLVIKYLTGINNGVKTYTQKSYKIIKETSYGKYDEASAGDIVAYRMCIFRFKSSTSDEIILCNSPIYNNISVSGIEATEAYFNTKPKVKVSDDTYSEVVTKKELDSLKDKVNTIENGIIWGNEDPEVALANQPVGTVYIKTAEED